MPKLRFLLPLCLICLFPGLALAVEPPRDWEPVELVGTATDYWFSRNWNSYYWREDFTFRLADERSGQSWRIISREPTPAYDFRMGTTFTGLAVDWKAKPRVKVVGVRAVDRIPVEFYDFKLDEANLATALVVYVETGPQVWKEFYVNNWFHSWGARADKNMFALYADKPPPYDIYGFVKKQAAPFDKKSQAIIDANKDNPSHMFHGRVRSTKGASPGYEIELIDLVGRDVKTGGSLLLFGDAKTIPLLDVKK